VNAGKTEFAFFFGFAALLHAGLMTGLRIPVTSAPLFRPTTILFQFDELAPQPAAPAQAVATPSPASASAASGLNAESKTVPVAKTGTRSSEVSPDSTRDGKESSLHRVEKREVPATSQVERNRSDAVRESSEADQAQPSRVASSPRTASSPAATAYPDAAAAQVRLEMVRASYEQVLAAWLDRHKYYPAPLRRRGYEGNGEMRIRIDRRGTVLYAAMSKQLPHAMLDEVALDWAARANPFPELPESIQGESYEFLVPVEFAIR
jgi:protein TonB